jgi:hypothetical protein
MIEGRCPKCGAYYHGWALLNPRHQFCPKCGVGLEIDDGARIFKGYSPFTGKNLIDDVSPDIPLSVDKEEGEDNQ